MICVLSDCSSVHIQKTKSVSRELFCCFVVFSFSRLPLKTSERSSWKATKEGRSFGLFLGKKEKEVRIWGLFGDLLANFWGIW